MDGTPGSRVADRVAPIVAVLVVIASLGGLLDGATYAHETAAWAAQGIGQDVFDLVVLAPCLIAAWAWARRDRARGAPVLGGALACTAYTFAIYAFGVHFNRWFLVYCAALGLSSYGLVALVLGALGSASAGARDRVGGGVLIATGIVFAALWLAEIAPALARRAPPPSLAEVGLPTNPVHVLDLAIALPAFVIAGVAQVRGRPIGRALAPIVASFGALMALSIATLMIVMRARGAAAELGVAAVMIVLAAISAGVAARSLSAR